MFRPCYQIEGLSCHPKILNLFCFFKDKSPLCLTFIYLIVIQQNFFFLILENDYIVPVAFFLPHRYCPFRAPHLLAEQPPQIIFLNNHFHLLNNTIMLKKKVILNWNRILVFRFKISKFYNIQIWWNLIQISNIKNILNLFSLSVILGPNNFSLTVMSN